MIGGSGCQYSQGDTDGYRQQAGAQPQDYQHIGLDVVPFVQEDDSVETGEDKMSDVRGNDKSAQNTAYHIEVFDSVYLVTLVVL